MRRGSKGAGRGVIASIVVSLVVAGAAVAAGAGAYTGKTSQHQPVSFGISRGTVRNFRIKVNDKCPDGHTLVLTGRYPPMPIRNRKFGGSFVPSRGRPGERSVLSATLGRRAVTGSISDRSISPREGRLCHGSAQFSAKHA
jgi:hypothetical protein